MGLGAYVTVLLIPHAAGREGVVVTTGLPFFLALLIGIISAALFGLLLGLPAIRLRGDYLAIVTIAAAEIFRLLVRDLEYVTGGVYGIINFSSSLQQYRLGFIDNFASSNELNPSDSIFILDFNNSCFTTSKKAYKFTMGACTKSSA